MPLSLLDHDSIHNRKPEWLGHIIERAEPMLWSWFQPNVRGIERIPTGPALYVGNHNSMAVTPDTFIFGCAAWRMHGAEAMPYALTHKFVLEIPGLREALLSLGSVRACHTNAHRIFQAGHKVLVYPGGDVDAMRPYHLRNTIRFGKRRGYIRLALREGVPIIPIVSAGAHETLYILSDGQWISKALRLDRLFRLKTFPISLSLPWGLTVGPTVHFPLRTRIHIEVLDPIHFDRAGDPNAEHDPAYVEECHNRVLTQMQETLDVLVNERQLAIANAKIQAQP